MLEAAANDFSSDKKLINFRDNVKNAAGACCIGSSRKTSD